MEILYSVEVTKSVFGFSAGGLIFAIAGLIVLVLSIFAMRDGADCSSFCLFLCTIVCISVSVALFLSAIPEYDYTKYYATIKDSTPISEVMDKYEIISIHGKIYELKEKENTNGND